MSGCRYATGPDLAAMHGFLDEAQTSAVDRSLEPTLLDPPVLERILKSASEEQQKVQL